MALELALQANFKTSSCQKDDLDIYSNKTCAATCFQLQQTAAGARTTPASGAIAMTASGSWRLQATSADQELATVGPRHNAINPSRASHS
eukprot:365474-Chlamydomonas_euryale.AAC.12